MFKGLTTILIQAAWMVSCLPNALEFKRIANQPVGLTQRTVLRRIVESAEKTGFGKKYRLSRKTTCTTFRNEVPVHDYEELFPWLERAMNGEQHVLSPFPVKFFEPTSGSTSPSKLIPYSKGLQETFNMALHPWLFDLFRNEPGLWGGPAYWVVTPRTAKQAETSGGIPIGFADDSEYFGDWAGKLVDKLMVVPKSTADLPTINHWRYFTLLSLLRTENMRMISLWNPSFLPVLLSALKTWSDDLVGDLSGGTCSNGPFSRGKRTARASFSPLPDRAANLRNLFPRTTGQWKGLGNLLWPRVCLISCWTEAFAEGSLPDLLEWFPGVKVQTKGLLATEGPVSFPMTGAPSPVLAANSCFYEFQEGWDGETPVRLAEELEPGGVYRVIMTTFGGLYRYRLSDVVRIRGFWRKLPCLEFLGKESFVCDLCGEKLNSRHVEKIWNKLFEASTGGFLAPHAETDPPCYLLFLTDHSSSGSPPNLESLWEDELSENFHYRWCRENGQLGPCQVISLPYNRSELEARIISRLQTESAQAGTAKFQRLSRLKNWKSFLST